MHHALLMHLDRFAVAQEGEQKEYADNATIGSQHHAAVGRTVAPSATGAFVHNNPEASNSKSGKVPSQVIQRQVTAEELQEGRRHLRRADYGVVHPDLQHIRTRRGGEQKAEDFFSHMVDVRRSTKELMSQPTGNRMLKELNAREAHINPPALGINPSTVVDIHPGTSMLHIPRHNDTNPDISDIQRGYRFDGVPGAGQASKITYNHNAPQANRTISLGHEMVHAWRTAHGLGVAPPQISPQRKAPVLNRPDDKTRVFEQSVQNHAHLQEEFETVGLSPTPHAVWAPTENMIRSEQARLQRNDYSSQRPGGFDDTINVLNDATDNRGMLDRFLGRPHPNQVWKLLNHLEE